MYNLYCPECGVFGKAFTNKEAQKTMDKHYKHFENKVEIDLTECKTENHKGIDQDAV